MDYSIILPAAGRSTRFTGRPKWSKTTPNGKLMLINSIDGLYSCDKKSLYVGLLSSQLHMLGLDLNKLQSSLNNKFNSSLLQFTEEQTKSHAETVLSIISNINNDYGLFIKDVDNYFETNADEYFDNGIGYISVIIADEFDGRVDNKSTIELDQGGFIKTILENNGAKSKIVCVGGYAFPNKSLFIEGYNACKNINSELKISTIINHLITKGYKFKIKIVSNYIDYGTQEEWDRHKNQHATLFVDFDGVLVLNGSEYFKNKWEDSKPIIDNINALNKEGYYVVITSSRPETYRDIVIKQLQEYNIKYNQLVLGLPAAKRILINDRAEENKTDTAFSININRNTNALQTLLDELDKKC